MTWLHSSILDSCNFQESQKLLTNNKAPGPDGINNELLKAIPLEYQQTIHKLLIIMWATGITPKNWKASETILIYKEKGPETDVASYRSIGLANTLYKLWTRLITNTLYKNAEVNSLLSNMQAGFRKKHDTVQQLQNVLTTLEDAKLYKQGIYALFVDFTSAFNTTDHDKLLLCLAWDFHRCSKKHLLSSTHQDQAAFGLHGRHPSWKRNNSRRHTLSVPVPDIHGTAALLAPCRQQGIHARPCWYQHTQHQSHKLHRQRGFCRRPDLSLRLLPKSPAPRHETYPIRRLGSPHNFRQKDEGP